MITDINGLTAQEWAEELFETEYCSECGRGVEDHDYILLNDHWFAKCKEPEICSVCLMKNYNHPTLQEVHKLLHEAIR